MIRVLFICHGNICRSTMAQFVFQDMVNRHNFSYESDFYIDSAATSTRGNRQSGPPRNQTTSSVKSVFPVQANAVQLKRQDYEKYDYLIGMDDWNIQNIMRISDRDPENKVHKLLDFTGQFKSHCRSLVYGKF